MRKHMIAYMKFRKQAELPPRVVEHIAEKPETKTDKVAQEKEKAPCPKK